MPQAIVPTQVEWNSALLEDITWQLRRRYSFLRVSSIGKSVLGRPLYQVSIGTGPRRVGYNASHHANEWITTPVLMKFLEQFAMGVRNRGYLNGVSCRRLFDLYTLDVVPMLNPDGVDLVTGYIKKGDAAYEKAQKIAAEFPRIPFPSGWKANIEGYDLNLAYPAQWERAKEIKFAQGFTRPAPRDYVGPTPLAAPESRALYERARAANYRLVLAYHTQGKLIYWDFDNMRPEGSYELAQRMAEASGYTVSIPPFESSAAGYKDWFIQDFNRPGYTIEAGRGQNPLPLSQFDEIYRDNLGILLLGMLGVK